MTTWYLGLNRGQTINPVGEISNGTGAPATDFYLAVSSTNNPTREDVILALNLFRQYILSNGLPAGAIGTNLPPRVQAND